MRCRRISMGAAALLALCLVGMPAWALPVNGDFSDGLNGWTADYDFGSSPATPGRETVVTDGYARLLTQGESSPVAVGSLWQWVEIPDDAASLSFDVWFGTEWTGSVFLDLLEVSYTDDGDWNYDRPFLAMDAYGPYDPSSFPFEPLDLEQLGDGWFRFRTDISELAGRSGTLAFDLWNEFDGNDSEARVDNVVISVAPVPEPATLLLLGTGLAGLAGACRRRRRG